MNRYKIRLKVKLRLNDDKAHSYQYTYLHIYVAESNKAWDRSADRLKACFICGDFSRHRGALCTLVFVLFFVRASGSLC